MPEDKLKELSERFKEIIFLYDSDETGIKESKERVEDFKIDTMFLVFNYHWKVARKRKTSVTISP